MGVRSSLLVVPSCEDPGPREEFPRPGEDTLQDYCQQALLSDGLQRIDKWTYVVQDWNGPLGVLEVSSLTPPPHSSA